MRASPFLILAAGAFDRDPGDPGSTSAGTTAQAGTIEVVDATTLIVRIGGETFTLLADPSDASGDTFEISDGSAVFTRELLDGLNFLELFVGDFDLMGAYGFETPVSGRPATATYDNESFGTLFYAGTNSDEYLVLTGAGGVSLVADFGAGTIVGPVFQGTGLADIDDDGSMDDTLSAVVTLNGTISATGFSGSLDGTAETQVNRTGSPIDLNLSLTNTTVTGKFFGNAAERAGGIYSGNAAISPAGLTAQSGTISGYFDALR